MPTGPNYQVLDFPLHLALTRPRGGIENAPQKAASPVAGSRRRLGREILSSHADGYEAPRNQLETKLNDGLIALADKAGAVHDLSRQIQKNRRAAKISHLPIRICRSVRRGP